MSVGRKWHSGQSTSRKGSPSCWRNLKRMHTNMEIHAHNMEIHMHATWRYTCMQHGGTFACNTSYTTVEPLNNGHTKTSKTTIQRLMLVSFIERLLGSPCSALSHKTMYPSTTQEALGRVEAPLKSLPRAVANSSTHARTHAQAATPCTHSQIQLPAHKGHYGIQFQPVPTQTTRGYVTALGFEPIGFMLYRMWP